MKSTRAICTEFKEGIHTSKRLFSHRAVRALKINKRVSSAHSDMKCVMSALRKYSSVFPSDRVATKHAMWRAVRAITPRYIPTPAFERIYAEDVDYDFSGRHCNIERYTSGRMSIVHRLFHYGYGEATAAIDLLVGVLGLCMPRVPSSYSPIAKRVLMIFYASGEDTKAASVHVLRAGVIVAHVFSDSTEFDRTLQYARAHKPATVRWLLDAYREFGSERARV